MNFSTCSIKLLTRVPLLLAALLLVTIAPYASAQGTNATKLLGQMSTAFAGSQTVQKVQASGSATWYAGNDQDTGTVNLTATSDGSFQMQLSLSSSGQRTETQVSSGSGAGCQWIGSDGIAHAVSSVNCWKPAVWFIPSISLQPSLIPNSLSAIDLGIGEVGASGNAYRHLQCQSALSGLPNSLSTNLPQLNTTDIGLDQTSLLPAVVTYTVLPDNGAQTPVSIEIDYSNYESVNGVQIPFHIRRFVNGTLQLDMQINSAQVN